MRFTELISEEGGKLIGGNITIALSCYGIIAIIPLFRANLSPKVAICVITRPICNGI